MSAKSINENQRDEWICVQTASALTRIEIESPRFNMAMKISGIVLFILTALIVVMTALIFSKVITLKDIFNCAEQGLHLKVWHSAAIVLGSAALGAGSYVVYKKMGCKLAEPKIIIPEPVEEDRSSDDSDIRNYVKNLSDSE